MRFYYFTSANQWTEWRCSSAPIYIYIYICVYIYIHIQILLSSSLEICQWWHGEPADKIFCRGRLLQEEGGD